MMNDMVHEIKCLCAADSCVHIMAVLPSSLVVSATQVINKNIMQVKCVCVRERGAKHALSFKTGSVKNDRQKVSWQFS